MKRLAPSGPSCCFNPATVTPAAAEAAEEWVELTVVGSAATGAAVNMVGMPEKYQNKIIASEASVKFKISKIQKIIFFIFACIKGRYEVVKATGFHVSYFVFLLLFLALCTSDSFFFCALARTSFARMLLPQYYLYFSGSPCSPFWYIAQCDWN